MRNGSASVAAAALPQLPKKGLLIRHASSDAAAAERAPALSAWLERVVSSNAALNSPSLLAFLGFASLETRSRAPLHVRSIIQTRGRQQTESDLAAESGDLILFRTRAGIPALQRAVTNSSWDHVGILLFRDGDQRVCASSDCGRHGDVGVLECDAAGTRFYPLRSYELAWHEQYDEIALRHLQWEEPSPRAGGGGGGSGSGGGDCGVGSGGVGSGDSDAAAAVAEAKAAFIQRMHEWYEEVLGAPYELTVGKLLGSQRGKSGKRRQGYLVNQLATSKLNEGGVGGAVGDGEDAASSSAGASAQECGGIGPPADDGSGSGGTYDSDDEETANVATGQAQQQTGFFCSELCAHGYKSVGILKPDRLASSYWPVHFAEATRHQLPLVEGVSFGDEVPIEFTTPEVGAMR